MRHVYFNEYNVLMGDTTYLPLVSGLLHAHALTNEKIRNSFSFAPYLFHIDAPSRILDQYREPPAVAAFSLLMWNEQLNLHVAREIKRRYPQCKIVVGGAQVPHHPEAYFREHPFIDIAIRGEGEEAFTDVLTRLADGEDLDGLAGVSWRAPTGEARVSAVERPFVRDLDAYPSPYLEGLYDRLMEDRRDLMFQAIVETNRGCPFHCTFCYWGKGGLSRKYRYHGLDRVSSEIRWMGERKVRYVFNADSNFGMNRRDREIAEFLVETKKRYGFPEKFRTCYGKNTDEKIFEIGSLFHKHQLEKGITISYQSTSPEVQKNIKRDNIKLSVARDLHDRFNKLDVPVYTELIIGLPGETRESWRTGIDAILASGLKNQLFMYICQVYPNTELGDLEYQRRFGVVTRRIILNEIHGSIRHDDWVPEYEDIIIATNSMTTEDWKKMLIFSWMAMLMHSLKMGFFVMCWLFDRHGVRHSEFIEALCAAPRDRFPRLSAQLAMFDDKVARILGGEGRGCVLPEYGPIYWDIEEAAFLSLSRDLPAFFAELEIFVGEFLSARGIDFDRSELADVVRYQSIRIPPPQGVEPATHRFEFNIPAYFERFFGEDRPAIARQSDAITIAGRDFANDPEHYARATILWGRKSGTMLTTVERSVLEKVT